MTEQVRLAPNAGRCGIVILGVLGISLLLPLGTMLAGGTTASVTVNSGALRFLNSTPSDIGFAPVSLNGLDSQSTTGSMTFDVSDATGSAAGWRIQASSTTFSDTAGHALPANATTIASAPPVACDAGSSCVPALTTVHFPYTLPTGAAAATTLFDARPGSGMGNENITPLFSLSFPGSASTGAYHATWTFSLVSGP